MMASNFTTGHTDRDAPGTSRLAAVAFVDIVGYSILMANNSQRTLARWFAILNETIRPRAADHRGRVVKTTGDGVLAEFPSARDAVLWAIAVQAAVDKRHHRENDDVPPILLRISVHIGDVVLAEDDIFGDGVNVAARLQEFAEPGGVIVSETVYDILRGMPGLDARDLGPLALKNFPLPVRGFALTPGVRSAPAPAAPPRQVLPSIAVLPLQNLTGDPQHAYFADGIVEDIIVSLAALHELLVISRGSTLMYHGRQVDPREVGRTLGVRYVLTGSLRMTGGMARVSVQLSDAKSGAHIWAYRREVRADEIFDLQDHVVGSVVAGIAPNIQMAELEAALRQRPESFNAYDLTLRALACINHPDREVFMQARDYLDRAIAEAPDFAMPIAWAARWHSLYIGQGWSDDPDADAERAASLAARAIERDGQNAVALATYGHLKSYLFHEYDSALLYLERARTVCPNSALAWVLSSVTLSYVGRGAEAVEFAERALRLSPFDQMLFAFYSALGLGHFTQGAYDEAVKWLRMSSSENPGFTANLRMLAAALSAQGRLDEARAVAVRMLEREPGFRVDLWLQRRQPFRDPSFGTRYAGLLREAGLPH